MNAIGIRAGYNSGLISGNTAYLNFVGISGDFQSGVIQNNRSYGNSNTGIRAQE